MKRSVCLVTLISLLAVVILISGCTTALPPLEPIKEFKDIAGTWEGSYTNDRTGRVFPGTRTIRADGTISVMNTNGASVDSGTLTLKDGKAVNSTDGTYTLHQGGAERILLYTTPRGSGRFTPAK